MTLQYKTIYTVLNARNRLSGRRRWLTTDRSGDQLTVFTLGTEAAAHSQANWQWLIEHGRRAGARIMTLRANRVQFLGPGLAARLDQWVAPDQWRAMLTEWREHSWYDTQCRWDSTPQGKCLTMRFYSDILCMPDQQGVWDLDQAQRLRSREQVVNLMWQYGFATQRGRVLGVADPRLAGSREELHHLEQMALKMSDRERQSEVALKICRLLRSVRRQVQWPGCM